MHVCETTCFAHKQNKTKLEARCKQGVFVGYDKCSPAYLVYHADTKEVQRYRCVKFIALGQPKLILAETSEHNKHDSNVNKENKNGDATQTASDTEHVTSRYPRRQHM